jgi:hypothetical protein
MSHHAAPDMNHAFVQRLYSVYATHLLVHHLGDQIGVAVWQCLYSSSPYLN